MVLLIVLFADENLSSKVDCVPACISSFVLALLGFMPLGFGTFLSMLLNVGVRKMDKFWEKSNISQSCTSNLEIKWEEVFRFPFGVKGVYSLEKVSCFACDDSSRITNYDEVSWGDSGIIMCPSICNSSSIECWYNGLGTVLPIADSTSAISSNIFEATENSILLAIFSNPSSDN